MAIHNIEQLQKLVLAGETDFSAHGLVYTQIKGSMILFCYTKERQFQSYGWNWFELNARGLILNRLTGEIISRPFRKFFNWGQRMPIGDVRLVSVVEKLDGSMVSLFRNPDTNQYEFATKGGFDTKQALWANQYARSNNLLSDAIDDTYTYIFECIYPENRIVVDYKDVQGLYLIGARDKKYGRELDESELDAIANEHQWARPLVYHGNENIQDVYRLIEKFESSGVVLEGCIARFTDREFYKLKTNQWAVLSRLNGNISFGNILRAYAAGTDVLDILGEEDEFFTEIRLIYANIDSAYQAKRAAFAISHPGYDMSEIIIAQIAAENDLP